MGLINWLKSTLAELTAPDRAESSKKKLRCNEQFDKLTSAFSFRMTDPKLNSLSVRLLRAKALPFVKHVTPKCSPVLPLYINMGIAIPSNF